MKSQQLGFNSSMIPKNKRTYNNGITTHKCITYNCENVISIKNRYCFCCEAKRLKKVYGIYG